jgi:hypothetical protein
MAIPQEIKEIINEIIEALGDEKLWLKNCTLVSSSFLLACRRCLWCKISLRPGLKGLHQVFVQNPVLQSFVTSITIICHGYRIYDSSEHDLTAVLRLPFCRMRSFTSGTGSCIGGFLTVD